MSRNIEYESLKSENFQLKNEITDLKNGFDLNRDVLKILQEHSKSSHPQMQIFYQIITRLTSINNQTMLNNLELLQDKNKLITENKIMKANMEQLNNQIDTLLSSKDSLTAKQIQMEMRDEMNELRNCIFGLNEDILIKKMEILRLESLLQEKEKEELKKPIIPSVKDAGKQSETESRPIPKTFDYKQQTKLDTLNRKLQRQNNHLKLLVQELEYRLTLVSNVYQTDMQEENLYQNKRQLSDRERQFQEEKALKERQLQLLMFAMKGTELQQGAEGENFRLTVTKRCKFLAEEKQKKILERSFSCASKIGHLILDRR